MSEKELYGIHFLSGGTALATAFAVMHPLDTLKIQIQATGGVRLSGELMRSLGRGFLTSVIGAAPQGGLRLATYEFTKARLQSHDPQGFFSTPISAISAIAGDFVSSIVKVPREVITSRLQVGQDAHLNLNNGSPTLNTIKQVLKEQGPQGLFRGFWSTTIRDWPFMVILFTTYESFKKNHKSIYIKSPSIGEDMSKTKSTLFGGVSGGLAGFLTTPFDVIKTVIMTSDATQKPSIGSVSLKLWRGYQSRRGGLGAFFAGGAARSVWWFCVCSMFFPIYESCKSNLSAALIDKNDLPSSQ